MNKLLLVLLSVLCFNTAFSQKEKQIKRPKLVVGIVVDQMRWDFLYRYYDRYSDKGFKRLMSQGFNCQNTLIPYTPTVTAAGHTSVYTGSVPAIHGIVGNNWYDKSKNKNVYCSEDADVNTVGADGVNGKQSPRNMLVTTIGDELKLHQNFRSKVYGVALKDRGSILPAGHAANAAFWFDTNSGKWITSSYYTPSLPAWLEAVNDKKLPDSFYNLGWNTLYPLKTYSQSTEDEKLFENTPFGKEQKKFPYNFQQFKGKDYKYIASTPHGNSMTLEIAKYLLESEKLGKSPETDMLCISLSSTDYVGHSFGPNSIETEDTYLRLDESLGSFLSFLDEKVGKDNYTLFLTADHGVAHVPGFMKENKLPAGTVDEKEAGLALNKALFEKFGQNKLVINFQNYQIYLNQPLMDSLKINKDDVTSFVCSYFEQQPYIAQAFPCRRIFNSVLPAKIKEMLTNGYFPARCGDIQLLLKPGYIDGGEKGTTHGVWSPYDAHIPLLFFGFGIKQGETPKEIYMTDIAPTIAYLLKIQMPSGSIGKVIQESLK